MVRFKYSTSAGRDLYPFAGYYGTKKAGREPRYHASLVEIVSDAIISSDADYKVLSWNKAAEEMYGLAR